MTKRTVTLEAAAAADALIHQWRESPRLQALVRGLLALVQDEIVAPLLRAGRGLSPDAAEGAVLDWLARRVGLVRPSVLRDDLEFFGFAGGGTGFDQAPFSSAALGRLAAALEPAADAVLRRAIKARARRLRDGADADTLTACAGLLAGGRGRVRLLTAAGAAAAVAAVHGAADNHVTGLTVHQGRLHAIDYGGNIRVATWGADGTLTFAASGRGPAPRPEGGGRGLCSHQGVLVALTSGAGAGESARLYAYQPAGADWLLVAAQPAASGVWTGLTSDGEHVYACTSAGYLVRIATDFSGADWSATAEAPYGAGIDAANIQGIAAADDGRAWAILGTDAGGRDVRQVNLATGAVGDTAVSGAAAAGEVGISLAWHGGLQMTCATLPDGGGKRLRLFPDAAAAARNDLVFLGADAVTRQVVRDYQEALLPRAAGAPLTTHFVN